MKKLKELRAEYEAKKLIFDDIIHNVIPVRTINLKIVNIGSVEIDFDDWVKGGYIYTRNSYYKNYSTIRVYRQSEMYEDGNFGRQLRYDMIEELEFKCYMSAIEGAKVEEWQKQRYRERKLNKFRQLKERFYQEIEKAANKNLFIQSQIEKYRNFCEKHKDWNTKYNVHLITPQYIDIDFATEEQREPEIRAEIEFGAWLENKSKDGSRLYEPNIMLTEALDNQNIEDIVDIIRSHIASLPYDDITLEKPEGFFRSNIYSYLKGCNIAATPEFHTINGRSDVIIEREESVYCFELKIDSNAKEALNQIINKGYLKPYKSKRKNLIAIGLSFLSNKGARGLSDYKYQYLLEK